MQLHSQLITAARTKLEITINRIFPGPNFGQILRTVNADDGEIGRPGKEMVENGEAKRCGHPLEPQRQIDRKQESLTSAAI
jgi:hypothetical protein